MHRVETEQSMNIHRKMNLYEGKVVQDLLDGWHWARRDLFTSRDAYTGRLRPLKCLY